VKSQTRWRAKRRRMNGTLRSVDLERRAQEIVVVIAIVVVVVVAAAKHRGVVVWTL
jgi:hypothetical protein